MKYWKSKLSTLLLAQLLLAAGIWILSAPSSREDSQAILNFDTASVSTIEIQNGENTLKLSKTNEHWTLPGYHQLPADQNKVKSLLKRLEGLSNGELVTKTSSSHERLQVTEENPSARITLFAGEEQIAGLLLGKSPAFGKLYVRTPDSDKVHSADWHHLDLQAIGSKWFDPSLLATRSSSKIQFPDFEIELKSGRWTTEDAELDQSKVKMLAGHLDEIRVLKVAEWPAGEDTEIISTNQSGKETTLLFRQLDDKHFVKRKGDDLAFQVGTKVAEKLLGSKLDELLRDDPQPTTTASPPP